MKTYESHVIKTIVACCDSGEDLYATLDHLVKHYEIRSGAFQVIGAVSRAKLGVFEHGKYEWIEHEGALEISSCLGNVSVKDGRPFVHCHAVLTDHRGTVIGGHVAEGCICDPTAEIHVQVYEGGVPRRHDKTTGLWLLDL